MPVFSCAKVFTSLLFVAVKDRSLLTFLILYTPRKCLINNMYMIRIILLLAQRNWNYYIMTGFIHHDTSILLNNK